LLAMFVIIAIIIEMLSTIADSLIIALRTFNIDVYVSIQFSLAGWI